MTSHEIADRRSTTCDFIDLKEVIHFVDYNSHEARRLARALSRVESLLLQKMMDGGSKKIKADNGEVVALHPKVKIARLRQ